MKANIWAYALLCAFCSFISCKTGLVDPEPITPPVVTKYTITASVVGQGGTVSPAETVVVKGGSVDFSITPQNGYKAYYITVNGVKAPLASTTYSILNVSLDYRIEVAFVSDNFLTINKGADDKTYPWHLKNISFFDDKNMFLDSLLLAQTPDRLTNNMFFYSNGKYEVLSKDNTKLVANGVWSTYDNIFVDGSDNCTILEIADKKIVYDYPSVNTNGKVTHKRETLVR